MLKTLSKIIIKRTPNCYNKHNHFLRIVSVLEKEKNMLHSKKSKNRDQFGNYFRKQF